MAESDIPKGKVWKNNMKNVLKNKIAGWFMVIALVLTVISTPVIAVMAGLCLTGGHPLPTVPVVILFVLLAIWVVWAIFLTKLNKVEKELKKQYFKAVRMNKNLSSVKRRIRMFYAFTGPLKRLERKGS